VALGIDHPRLPRQRPSIWRSALVANSHHYFRGVTNFKSFISAVLAVILWPLVLARVNLHVT
jgi:hypothetical protein